MPPPTHVCDGIKAKLVAQGLPASIITPVLAALDAAGYDLVAKEGGNPVSVVGTLVPVIHGVEGMPGTHIVSVDVGGGVMVRWVELHRDGKTLRMPMVGG